MELRPPRPARPRLSWAGLFWGVVVPVLLLVQVAVLMTPLGAALVSVGPPRSAADLLRGLFVFQRPGPDFVLYGLLPGLLSTLAASIVVRDRLACARPARIWAATWLGAAVAGTAAGMLAAVAELAVWLAALSRLNPAAPGAAAARDLVLWLELTGIAAATLLAVALIEAVALGLLTLPVLLLGRAWTCRGRRLDRLPTAG